MDTEKKVNKLTDEEFKELMNIREKYTTLLINLGQLDINIQDLNETRNKFYTDFKVLQEEYQKQNDAINKKYGQITINPIDGTFITVNENNSQINE
jgi:hypothetical protein